MAKTAWKEITVDDTMIDFQTKDGPRHRIYALKKGEWMKCPTKSTLIFEGPSVVWYQSATDACKCVENCTEYDVNDKLFWNAIASVIEWRVDVLMHNPVDPNRRGSVKQEGK